MGKLIFNDGVEYETGGPYRVMSLTDGFYAVGHGCSIPCRDYNEAEATVRALTAKMLDGAEIPICVAALNRMNWAEIGEQPPGVIATNKNLQYFTPDAIIMALRAFRPQIMAEYLPVVDKLLAKLEEKNGSD